MQSEMEPTAQEAGLEESSQLLTFTISRTSSLGLAASLSCAFVGVLYLSQCVRAARGAPWVPEDRNHPRVIRKRILSVVLISLASPLLLYVCATPTSDPGKGHTLARWLGLRLDGLAAASIIPLGVTVALFLGPIVQNYLEHRECCPASGSVLSYAAYLASPAYWAENIGDLTWVRNVLVAPASEEFVFRSCLLPALVPGWGRGVSVVVDPAFFALAHYHHVAERVREGHSLGRAFLISTFQFMYTFLFGAYSAWVFLVTGHFAASFLVHAFCNSMGLPDLAGVIELKGVERALVMAAYGAGVVAWSVSSWALLYPALYENDVYFPKELMSSG